MFPIDCRAVSSWQIKNNTPKWRPKSKMAARGHFGFWTQSWILYLHISHWPISKIDSTHKKYSMCQILESYHHNYYLFTNMKKKSPSIHAHIVRYLWLHSVQWVIAKISDRAFCIFVLTHSRTNELKIRPATKLNPLYPLFCNYDS